MEIFSSYFFRFPENATNAIQYLRAIFRLLGYFNLLLGSIGIILLWRYRVNQQVWVLCMLITTSLLAYLGPIIFDNTVGNIGPIEIIEHLLFIGMILSGISMIANRK
jgi:hypothetical protein